MRTLICLTCLLLASTANAGPVYKWKDANGVTQYSGSPPAGRKFETRQLTRDPVPTATTPAEAPVPAPCTSARESLALLDGDEPVMQDTNGDGKGDVLLEDAQRADQRALAAAAVKAYCPPGAG